MDSRRHGGDAEKRDTMTKTIWKVAALKNTKPGRSYGRTLATCVVEAETISEAHAKARAVFAVELKGLKIITDIVG